MIFGSCSGCAALREERDHLRSLLDAQLDHNRRLERVAAGAPELAPKPRKPAEPMPQEIRDKLRSFDSLHIRKQLESEARTSYQETGSWAEVAKRLDEVLGDDAAEEED